LSCPSSLPGHSDFPTSIPSILPVSPGLIHAYRSWSSAETLGSQALPPLSFTACHWPYPGSPSGAFALCFPDGYGLLPKIRGSACIPAQRGLSLSRTLPAITVQPSFYEAAPFALCCGLRFWQAPLAGLRPAYHASRLGTVSGQVQPVCYHTNPPSAYLSERAIDKITSFQVIR